MILRFADSIVPVDQFVIGWSMIRAVFIFLLGALMAQAEFFKIRISDLRVEEEYREWLEGRFELRNWRSGQSLVPMARFKNFAFVVPDLSDDEEDWLRDAQFGSDAGGLASGWLVMEVTDKIGRKGFLDVWDTTSSLNRWRSIPCEIRPSSLKQCDDKEEALLLAWHDRHRLSCGDYGGLWYRARSKKVGEQRVEREFDQTFEVLSGGRAIAENLALDRDLILGQDGKDGEVLLSEIKGVTVAPIPWEERMTKGEIKVDILAMKVPADQHFLVVPSFGDFLGLIRRLETNSTPILRSFSAGSEYRDLASRYCRQMGLDLPEAFAKLLPVKTVGVTGGDPFFPTGSDVAVMLETDKPGAVIAALKRTVGAKARSAGAREVQGELLGFQNADRSFSSFLMELDGAVVVANSPAQLVRLKEVADKKTEALGAIDEYRFFRHRYPVGQGERAYVFISDACLRRWAGPELRIGASRRSRALAALASTTASHIQTGKLDDQFKGLLGSVNLVGEKVISEKYNSLGFVTPVGELGLKRVTTMEKEGYDRWRRGYENGWARFFDPIAIQFRLGEEREDLDMTILPLRVDSDYDELISLAGAAVLSKGASRVPDESVFHFAMAVDKESDLFKQASIGLVDLLPGLSVNPLGWMGESVAVTLGDDLVWESEMGDEIFTEMPVLVRVDVESKIKLALFLTAFKGAVQVASPDLVDWETRKHGERKYVVMSADADDLGFPISIYYATVPGAFLVTLNEEMLKRAIDRELNEDKKGKAEGQILAQTNPRFLTSALALGSNVTLADRERFLSYQALPILNEWYKTREAKDPVAFHQARFVKAIECPGGKGYHWNAEDLTMESVVYGHPGKPRGLEIQPEWLAKFQTLRAVGSFEEGGLRMKVGLDSESRFVDPVVKGKPRPGDDKMVALRDLLPLKGGTKLAYRFDYEGGFEEDPTESTLEVEITKVTKDGELLLIEEKGVSEGDDEKHEEVSIFELGPNGYRLVKTTGESGVIGPKEGYYYPPELWPGQNYRVRYEEKVKEEGSWVRYRVDGMVSVIGWEVIEGPSGEKIKALKSERREASIYNRDDFYRSLITEWHAPGMGVIKSVERGSWGGQTTMTLEKFEQPE